jgi:hypothetical protein
VPQRLKLRRTRSRGAGPRSRVGSAVRRAIDARASPVPDRSF